MAGTKTFINNTEFTLRVSLIIRDETNINGDGGRERFRIEPGASKEVTYGAGTNNIFLNGFRLTWKANGARLREIQRVNQKSGALDNMLNTNSIITFNGVCQSSVTGKN